MFHDAIIRQSAVSAAVEISCHKRECNTSQVHTRNAGSEKYGPETPLSLGVVQVASRAAPLNIELCDYKDLPSLNTLKQAHQQAMQDMEKVTKCHS